MLLCPPGTDKGESDNLDVTLLPPNMFIHLTLEEDLEIIDLEKSIIKAQHKHSILVNHWWRSKQSLRSTCILHARTHCMQKQSPICNTTRRLCKKRNPEHLSQLKSGRTLRKRPNLWECRTMVLVARHARMDCIIHQRLRSMPTKQSPYPLHESPPLLHKHTTQSPTIPSHCNGFNHPTSQNATGMMPSLQ